MNQPDRDFWRHISIVDVAVNNYGYVRNEKESTPSRVVLQQNGGGSKGGNTISVKINCATQVFFNFRNSAGGSIIAFILDEENLANDRSGVARACDVIRNLEGYEKLQVKREVTQTLPEERPKKTVIELTAEWEKMAPYDLPYLTETRGIHVDFIRAFGVKKDTRGNACFKHTNQSGICGWEKKNEGFGGYSEASTKGLAIAKMSDDQTRRLCIFESSVDAISFAQLYGVQGDLFISVAGTPSSKTNELLSYLFFAHPSAEVVCCHDADSAGDEFSKNIIELAPTSSWVSRARPHGAKDWNDVLLNRPNELIPVAKSTVVFPTRAARRG